jgi:plastocyanin
MKRIALLSVVAVSVVLVSGSTAATQQVSIGPRGFTPKDVTVALGDTVTWTNTDTRNRRIASTQAGFTSPVLAPSQTFSFTFTKAGKFAYEDPTVAPKQRGSVTVRKAAAGGAASLTAAAVPTTVTFGRATTLSGKASSGRAGEKVTVSARGCKDKAYVKVGDVTTAADGAWTLQAKPLDHTTYRAQWGTASAETAVRERPRLSLGKIAAHKFRVRVYAHESFAGKNVTFQRWNAAKRRWAGVRSVKLADTGLGVDPTVISGADFRSRIAAGKRVRVFIGQTAAGACYLANASGSIRS